MYMRYYSYHSDAIHRKRLSSNLQIQMPQNWTLDQLHANSADVWEIPGITVPG
jgi:hypothetical protein